MKISTKGRYGLTAMVDLAINCISENVTLKSISERQHISERYLEQIFSTLRKSGLVKSIKGSQGGYVLGKDASDISIGEILRTLEGSMNITDDEEKDVENDNLQICIKTNVWDKINEGINSVIDSISLDYLVFQYSKLNEASQYFYYI